MAHPSESAGEKPQNQGEGDREADRRYRGGAQQFIEDGRVAPAARAAERAVDGDEASALGAAERAGKARIAEDDAAIDDGPLPSFWTHAQQTGWDRVKQALERDWLQTKADLGLPDGEELGQTAKQTMKQAAGVLPLPGSHTERPSTSWEIARRAVRFGFGASFHWYDEEEWSDEIDLASRTEWERMDTGLTWHDARRLAMYGWDQGRRERQTMPGRVPR